MAKVQSTSGIAKEYERGRPQAIFGAFLFFLIMGLVGYIMYRITSHFVGGFGQVSSILFSFAGTCFFIGRGFYISVDGEELVLLRDDMFGTLTQFSRKGLYFKAPWEGSTDVVEKGNEDKVTRDLQSVKSVPTDKYTTSDKLEVLGQFFVQYQNDPELLGQRNLTPSPEIILGIQAFFGKTFRSIIAKYTFEERAKAEEDIEKWLNTEILPEEILSPPEKLYGIRIRSVGAVSVLGTPKTLELAAIEAEGKAVQQGVIEFAGGPAVWSTMDNTQKETARSQFLAYRKGDFSRTEAVVKGDGKKGKDSTGALIGASLAAGLARDHDNNN